MAHHLKVVARPHKNKDGSDSKTKKDYVVTDRTRQGVEFVGVATSKQKLEEIKTKFREVVVQAHLDRHPNDLAFKRKHGLI